MSSIFIITGAVGEYSDRTEWVVSRAFRDEEQAKALVAEIMEECQRVSDHFDDYIADVGADGVVEGQRGPSGAYTKLPSKLRALDKNFYRFDSGRYPPTYSVQEIELCDAIDSFLDRSGVERAR